MSCSVNNCDLEVYRDNKCILHCKKYDYQDERNNGTLQEFYEEIKNYISNYENKDFIIFTNIAFPSRDSRDYFDYLNILKQFNEIHFNYCYFYTDSLVLKDTKVFFQDCIFYNTWDLYDYKLLENADDVIYKACIFKEEVSCYPIDDNQKINFSNSQFDYTSKFNNKLYIYNATTEKELFFSKQENQLEKKNLIKELIFEKTTINRKLKLKNYEISYLIFKDSYIKSSLELIRIQVYEFTVKDSSLEKEESIILDFDNKLCRKIDIKNTTFKKDSKLHLKNLTIENFELSNITQDWSEAIFENIIVTGTLTFDNVDFRKAKFINCDFSGATLDIKDSVYIAETVFNGTEFSDKLEKLSQEFSRQMKTTLDSQGNYIEANKFYSQEMRAYQKKLSPKPFWANVEEKFIFWLNKTISNFGQSWLLPIFWFFVVTMGFIIGMEVFEKEIIFTNNKILVGTLLFIGISVVGFIHKYTEPIEIVLILFSLTTFYYLQVCNLSINKIAEFSNIKNKNYEDFYFLWFLHKAILSVLIYHLTIALRRQTKR